MDPWDERYIYLHENRKKSTIHVGKYTVRPMDPMWDMLSSIFRGAKKKKCLLLPGDEPPRLSIQLPGRVPSAKTH